MLRWIDILKFANNGNPSPDQKITKTDQEWKGILSPEEFLILRQKGTERPFSSEMCGIFEPGRYACAGCGTELFDASEKFDSGSGWPSFTQPVETNSIAYHKDNSHGMSRIEVTCNSCDAHLGHVFPDGPEPGGLRYCINALVLKKVQGSSAKAVFGGGCFWCTEAVFQKLQGVLQVVSGYSGGHVINPSYREVCNGQTGHAEVVKVTYNPQKISYADLLRIHLATHDPTQLNRQGGDMGTQYRSVIFVSNQQERQTAQSIIDEFNHEVHQGKVVTEIADLETFYPAEDCHQNYYQNNPDAGYCLAVIHPKLKKFTKLFHDKLKAEEAE